ncbi:hypothetical protein NDU88_005529 [Pleurodeles waltl]|uniref:Uncharacterized protein n=1 Tax=Pleurodeles waltl TaxID=8319 RepID=A0AAV7MEW3_PLEWA|nr:hypothetical protein NDU88_005529 [Pleurodeles waltl]
MSATDRQQRKTREKEAKGALATRYRKQNNRTWTRKAWMLKRTMEKCVCITVGCTFDINAQAFNKCAFLVFRARARNHSLPKPKFTIVCKN